MYFEATVVFIEEIQTKNGVKEKKVRRSYLVECDSVTVAEAKVNEFVKDSPFIFETISLGKIFNLDPFDQPAVEEVKSLTKRFLKLRKLSKKNL